LYSGQYSEFRRRRHGNSAEGARGEQFVVCTQNHDQIGNRAQGDRLSTLVDFESLKLAAGAVIFSPFVPLLFMGEEYGETAPFLYFTSHSDTALIEAVRRGRQEEFAAFAWQAEAPDPQDERSFLRCRLTPEESWSPQQRLLREFYRELLRIRRSTPALSNLAMEQCRAIVVNEQTLLIHRWCDSGEALVLLQFASASAKLTVPCPAGRWSKVIESADARWGGAGSAPAVLNGECEVALPARSLVLYQRD
jgi:maltooligosyltrehalose trehalohydrolase